MSNVEPLEILRGLERHPLIGCYVQMHPNEVAVRVDGYFIDADTMTAVSEYLIAEGRLRGLLREARELADDLQNHICAGAASTYTHASLMERVNIFVAKADEELGGQP